MLRNITRYILIIQFIVFILILTNKEIPAEISGNEAVDRTRVINAKNINWDEIRILDLKTAGQITLAGNPSLAAAKARVRQAKERVLQARSAYWPQLDATASLSRVRLSDNAYQVNLKSARLFDPTSTIDDPEDYYNAGLMATWVLFNGFERKFSNAAARYGKDQSESAQKDLKRLILSSVAGSYFAAQLALENIAIDRADEVFYNRQLMEAKARRRVGTGSLSDELNFKIRVNSARAKLLEAEKNYAAAMFGLAALLGIPDATFPALLKLARLEPETPEEMVPPDPDSLIAFACEHRPDIFQTDFALKQAGSEVEIARAKYFPTINLSASLDGDRTGNGNFEQDDFGSSVAIGLSYNLFSGGFNRANLSKAREKHVEAKKSLENIKISVTSEVRGSVANVELAQKQLVLQRSNAILVRQNRDLVEKEYKAGQGSLVRLNEAQRDLITARSRLAFALVSLRQSWYNLETDTGRILVSFSEF